MPPIPSIEIKVHRGSISVRVGNAFCSHSCGHRMLERRRCRFHGFAELLVQLCGTQAFGECLLPQCPGPFRVVSATLSIFPNESRHLQMGVPLLSPFALPSRTDCGCHGTDPKVVLSSVVMPDGPAAAPRREERKLVKNLCHPNRTDCRAGVPIYPVEWDPWAMVVAARM